MKPIKSKKGESNLMLNETAMLILVASILIVMLIILVRMYSLFEDADVIASKQAYNRVLKAIESVRNDGDIAYEYASLRNNHGILILNSETTTQEDSIMLFNPRTIGFEKINILEEYKKDTPKICYVYTEKQNQLPRTIKINNCARLKTNLDKNYILEQSAIPLEIKKESSLIRITTSSIEYDPAQYNDPEASMLYYSYYLPSKMRDSNTLIDLEVENWFSLDTINRNNKIIVEKEGQYALKGLHYDLELTLANTYVDIGIVLITSYYLNPLDEFKDITLSKFEYNGISKEVKLSAIENIGKLKIDNLNRLEVNKLSTAERPNININQEFLQVINLGEEDSNICAKNNEAQCVGPFLKEFKKMYLYRIEGPYITLGFFILSDNDLEESKFKLLVDDPNFQNKVKELVCGEGNIDDCDIF